MRRPFMVDFAMHVNVGIWGTLNKIAVFLLFVAGMLGVFFWYLPLIQQNERYRKEIIALDGKVQEEERIARLQKAALDALLNDPRTTDRLVRERLGYAKTNETVFRFETSMKR
jgi:hypothetical protein